MANLLRNRFNNLSLSLRGAGCQIFDAYPKQQEFFALGAQHDTRVMSGGNRTGKTAALGAGEVAYHLTGLYPDDWPGRVFTDPIDAWVGSTDWSTNVVGCQLRLLGDLSKNQLGLAVWDEATQMWVPCGVPRSKIIDIQRAPNVPGAIAAATIRHSSGGVSRVRFVAYSKGRENLQAGKAQLVWMDEEPPEDVATELMARTMDSRGINLMSFTPLKGLSAVVKRFIGDVKIDEDFPETLISDVGALVRIKATDAPHIDDKLIKRMMRDYPEHEHMARIWGIPALGEGAIFPFSDDRISSEYIHPDSVPGHWMVLDGIDLGINHPTTRARVYMDPDRQAFYLAQEYKVANATTKVHAANWGEEFVGDVPVIWPGDGKNRVEDITGDDLHSIADRYRALGVALTADHVHMPSGDRLSSEGAVNIMYELMEQGRFKAFRNCSHFFAEKALYRREKKGSYNKAEIHGVFDDVIHATRNAILGLLSGEGHTVMGALRRSAMHKRRVVRDDYRSAYADDDDADEGSVDFVP